MNTESGNSFPENAVLVVGAGVSGVCAALQCARSGVRCLLIERSGINGGTLALSGIASPGLFFDGKGRQVIAGIGWELVHECVETCGDTLPEFTRYRAEDFWRFEIPVDPVVFTALCDEKLLAEGVEVRYHTMLAGLQRQGNSWRAAICEKDGLQEVVRIAGDKGRFDAWLPSSTAYDTAGNAELGIAPDQLLNYRVDIIRIDYYNADRRR